MTGSRFAQLPPQDGTYTVKVKNGSGWRNYSACRLQISVGQPYHEGEKMAATINWVKDRFDLVIVCVNDTLQRYNTLCAGNISPAQAEAQWNTAGDAWINRHMGSLSKLKNCEIFKWNDWKARPDYTDRQIQTHSFYLNNITFRESIDRNVLDFWDRNKDRLTAQSPGITFDDFARFALFYLLEETAMFSLMFEDRNAVDIYPGSVLLPATLFRGNPVSGMPPGLDKGAFTRIDFQRRVQKTPISIPAATPVKHNQAA